jgi:hypothetical protein
MRLTPAFSRVANNNETQQTDEEHNAFYRNLKHDDAVKTEVKNLRPALESALKYGGRSKALEMVLNLRKGWRNNLEFNCEPQTFDLLNQELEKLVKELKI